MKKTPFILMLALTFALEIAVCILTVSRIRPPKNDTVEINECMHLIEERYPGLEDDWELSFAVIDSEGKVLYKTDESAIDSIGEAVKEGGLILDLEVKGETIGKVIFDSGATKGLEDIKKDYAVSFAVIALVQIAVVCCWYIYMNRTVVKPFKRMLFFATRVAEGNLDIPLEMDRSHVFGEFTEAFDIMRSELKKARIAEKKANDDKKEMVAKLSHDIKTPVASIKSSSEIGREITNEERVAELFDVINKKSDQLKALTDNLFTSSVGDIVEIEVSPSMQESETVATLIKNADYLGKAYAFDMPECSVYMDRLRLQQVFDNIFMNSYKYADTPIHVSTALSGDYLVIRIADEGPGVSEGELPLLKEKFKRGSNVSDRDGAGLGLYLADCFCNKMDGKLSLRNLDKGFEVSVYLRVR